MKKRLLKSDRILKPADYLEVRKKGTRQRTANFIIHTLVKEEGSTRLGLSVSARYGNAVQRNRLKRVLKEFFRLNKDKFKASTDILITAKSRPLKRKEKGKSQRENKGRLTLKEISRELAFLT